MLSCDRRGSLQALGVLFDDEGCGDVPRGGSLRPVLAEGLLGPRIGSISMLAGSPHVRRRTERRTPRNKIDAFTRSRSFDVFFKLIDAFTHSRSFDACSRNSSDCRLFHQSIPVVMASFVENRLRDEIIVVLREAAARG